MQDTPSIGSLRQVTPEDPLVAELGELEPVNPPMDGADLARRVADDRVLYVLEVDEQVAVALWVALTVGIPNQLPDVLDPGVPVIDPGAADTAVFHSVWNLPGRPSVPGGARSTIERAVEEVRRRWPRITTAVTLSPIPGLRSWIESQRGVERPEDAELVALATQYLHTLDERGLPIDPVAQFHLGNGARLWRVLLDADRSATGLERSWGVMANYRYAPEDRAANRSLLATGVVPDDRTVTDPS